ncbi:ribosome-binding factor A [Candidatus Saccharibacteria bacterium]|nr:ribosome-binding factor A [Candidatus Saccharibacteria bacterium]
MSVRTEKIAATIERLAATYFLELQPELGATISVVRIEVSGDLKHAGLFISALGKNEEQAYKGILEHQNRLQSIIAAGLTSKFTPKLKIVLDRGLADSARVSQLLQKDQA